ncbi:hypothetical protein [Candidatus Bathycorpusculum sp.]|uniref:hypothetical protein n=1 Tax=Candidatus Bathycorpusculum sp. TaxID=2994959 RepID=UPI00283109FA|nr:hypothetical protein [Candidatus Termitimicrobium sp.]
MGTFSLTDGNTWNSGPLAPGNYTLTEIAQAGWDLSNIIIIDPTNNSRVDLATRTVFIALDPGETISIFYQNTQQASQTGSISVVKTTCPVGSSAVFNFITSTPVGTFSLSDGELWNSGPLAPGNYTITELAQAGWDLSNIIVNDPDSGSRVDLASGTVFVDLDPGESITLFYQNTQQAPLPGSISVSKVSCPVGSLDVFRFVTSVSPFAFNLSDGGTWSSGDLSPGTYTVTELVPQGWTIANILIDDPSGNSSVNLSSGTATVVLSAGSHVSIVYQNAEMPPQSGFISVVKAVCPVDADDSFVFVSSASEGSFSLGNGEVWNSGALAPGRYIVTEVMQAGWTISDIIIADPSGTSTADLSTGTATINLQAGSHVTIIYQNTQHSKPSPCPPTPCPPKPSCPPTPCPPTPCPPKPSCPPTPCPPKPSCPPTPCPPKPSCPPTPCPPTPSCPPKPSCPPTPCPPKPSCPPTPCPPKPSCHPTSSPCLPKPSCPPYSVHTIEETPANLSVETDVPIESESVQTSISAVSEETQTTNHDSSNTSSSSTSSGQSSGSSGQSSGSSGQSSGSSGQSSGSSGQSSDAGSSSSAGDALLSSPAPVIPSVVDSESISEVVSEGSVLFGLDWFGAVLVVLFGVFVAVLAVTAVYLQQKKHSKLQL